MNGALLSTSDLPTGFTAMPPTPSSDTSKVCGLQSYRDRAVTRGEIDFQQQPSPTSVMFIGDSIDAFPAGVAKTALDQVQAGLSSCTSFTTTSSGQTITFQVSRLSFPRLDDQTLALRLMGQPQGGALQGTSVAAEIIVIRAGNNIAVVGNVSIPGLDSSLTESLARRQATNLAAL